MKRSYSTLSTGTGSYPSPTKPNLPDDLDRVPCYLRVGAQEGHLFEEGLSDKDAVERVAVVVGQGTGVQGVAEVDGQRRYGVPEELISNESLQLVGHFQPAESDLYGDLPPARSREEQLVATVADDLPRPIREPVVVGDPPQESVRVE